VVADSRWHNNGRPARAKGNLLIADVVKKEQMSLLFTTLCLSGE
jgi:hypothetical protein